MGIKRHKPEEIVTKLRQVEVLCGQGMPRLDAFRQVQITERTFYRWRKQYGGMGTDQLKELKRLQKENDRLRRAVSDLPRWQELPGLQEYGAGEGKCGSCERLCCRRDMHRMCISYA